MLDNSGIVLGILGSSAVTAVITYALTRPKVLSETELNEVNAGAKTVEMALAFAEAADKKAKDIEVKLNEFASDFKDLQTKFNDVSREYVELLKYNAEVKKALASFDPNHPLLKRDQ